jgi:hypothetical protein
VIAGSSSHPSSSAGASSRGLRPTGRTQLRQRDAAGGCAEVGAASGRDGRTPLWLEPIGVGVGLTTCLRQDSIAATTSPPVASMAECLPRVDAPGLHCGGRDFLVCDHEGRCLRRPSGLHCGTSLTCSSENVFHLPPADVAGLCCGVAMHSTPSATSAIDSGRPGRTLWCQRQPNFGFGALLVMGWPSVCLAGSQDASDVDALCGNTVLRATDTSRATSTEHT